MENRDNQNSDISKSQSAQQPIGSQQAQPEQASQEKDLQAGQQPLGGQQGVGQSESFETGQADYGSERQSDAMLDEPTGGLAQASDIEGSSQSATTGGESSGFVGSDGASDSSESLIDDESSDFAKDGQGAAE